LHREAGQPAMVRKAVDGALLVFVAQRLREQRGE
jgi:hypothetical protein